MELGETSDYEEQAVPDIIISRSSIPEAERARNIRMVPMLEDHEEESETDSSKESGASDDVGDTNEDFRQETRPPSGNVIETVETKDNNASIQVPTQQHGLDSLSGSTKTDAASNMFPTPNVEEFLSEYEDATEDEQVLVADQTHQFKVDTAAFEHLESSAPNEQDNADKFSKNCCHK